MNRQETAGAWLYPEPMSFDHMFFNGVKRDPGTLLHPPRDGLVLNLGAGNARIDGAVNLDRPEWNAADGLERFGDREVKAIHMHHFLEHLDVEDVTWMLQESQRVLVPGGVVYITVPHAMCPLAYQAPDHRTYWTEEGWQDTFYSAGYDSAYGFKWSLDITWMIVAGVKWSNLCVMLQLAKRVDSDMPYKTPWRRNA